MATQANEPIAAGLTDVGKVRSVNEDSFAVDVRLGLYVVADGMGGHVGGAIASRVAVEAILEDMNETAQGGASVAVRLGRAVARACVRVQERGASQRELEGMGTTVVALCLRGASAAIAHVGDSRAYRIRNAHASQLGEDHSLVSEQVRAGLITSAQAAESPYRNVITRCVGFEDDVQVDIAEYQVFPGDVFLLCSDGLHTLVGAAEIAEIVHQNPPAVAAKRLVALANERGGDDNITVVVVAVPL